MRRWWYRVSDVYDVHVVPRPLATDTVIEGPKRFDDLAKFIRVEAVADRGFSIRQFSKGGMQNYTTDALQVYQALWNDFGCEVGRVRLVSKGDDFDWRGGA